MPHSQILPEPRRLDVQGVDELLGVHRQKQLRLAFTVGLSGMVHLDGDPQALVTEVLRLARTGAIAEATAREEPFSKIVTVVADARARWRSEIGGL